ncbi:MAG: inositol 2-dehydrogenase [Spirochaetaceae bacterium]|nr:MAG: inositol 2-dehydrogenase [Spirochaetaceae bacterium]
MKQTVNIAVIGAGRIGRLHAEHLAHRIPGVRLSAIADVNKQAAVECAAAIGVPKALKEHRGILEDPEVQAVVICSSTDTHASLIAEAAAAGKHIFCEKPIALDLKQIDDALAAASSAGVKLQVGFNRRFDANFSRMRELVREGAIGEPHLLRIASRDPAPPPIEYVRVSGGIFLDMMIHDFDMARYLVDDEVAELYAVGGVRIDPQIGKAGDIDTAVVTLKFVGGCFATIDNSRRAVYGYDQRAEVFGAKGMVTTENNTPNRIRLSTGQTVREDLPQYFFMERYTESYLKEMNAFIECIREDKPPPVTGLDGKVPVVMGKAARLSYEQNRPVALSEIS